MGNRLPGCERRSAVHFLRTSTLMIFTALLLVFVLFPMQGYRKLMGQPVRVR